MNPIIATTAAAGPGVVFNLTIQEVELIGLFRRLGSPTTRVGVLVGVRELAGEARGEFAVRPAPRDSP